MEDIWAYGGDMGDWHLTLDRVAVHCMRLPLRGRIKVRHFPRKEMLEKGGNGYAMSSLPVINRGSSAIRRQIDGWNWVAF
jgi:hypothetical protein